MVPTRGNISIHAPPRGATLKIATLPHAYKHFNSRPSARGDACAIVRRGLQIVVFQFTPLREGRLAPTFGQAPFELFQFTPLREGRRISKAISGCEARFQFTPLREGRHNVQRAVIISLYFNSRPSARGDSKRYAISANLLFNPYKSAWLNNNATQFVEIILVIFHRIIA